MNLSLGGPTSDRLERAAVAYAVAHDVLVVAAAGNEGTVAKQYPGALPGVARGRRHLGSRLVTRPVLQLRPLGRRRGTRPVDRRRHARWRLRDRRRHVVLRAARLRRSCAAAAGRPGRTRRPSSPRPSSAAPTPHGSASPTAWCTSTGRWTCCRPASAPAVSSPADGAVVSGRSTVTATSSAPRVRLGLGRPDDHGHHPVTGGTPVGDLRDLRPRWQPAGRPPPTAARSDQCNDPTPSTVSVDNAAPAITSPAAGRRSATTA